VEFTTIRRNFQFDPNLAALDLVPGKDPVKDMKRITKLIGEAWLSAQNQAIKVAPYPKYTEKEMKESVKRGWALFLADEEELAELKIKGSASCVSCHKDYGRQGTFRFDDWGTLVRPADLVRGVYRGGGRPVDIYYRIHSGINGSGMAPFGASLSGEQLWDIVNFVRTLPFKGMRDKFSIHID